MPYQKNSDLPVAVQHALPSHAQDIYREAFNHAWEEYKSAEKKHDPEESRESVSHKVAWSAVKKTYHKTGDTWVEKG